MPEFEFMVCVDGGTVRDDDYAIQDGRKALERAEELKRENPDYLVTIVVDPAQRSTEREPAPERA